MKLTGKTIEKVVTVNRFNDDRPDQEVPFGEGLEPSFGADVIMSFTDGTHAILRCCSCCDGLEIEGSE